jgi:hypothetical protein
VEAEFSAPLQIGPGVHSASYTMGTGSFQRVQQPGCGVNHPPRLASRLKKVYILYLLPLFAFMTGYRVDFTFKMAEHCLNKEII